jgi:hypothetical protein
MAIGVYASVYLEYTPLYHCVSGLDPQDSSLQSMYNPNDDNLTCSSSTESGDSSESTECSNWVFDTSVFTMTVISEFEIICNSSYLKTLSTTIYMSGMLGLETNLEEKQRLVQPLYCWLMDPSSLPFHKILAAM